MKNSVKYHFTPKLIKKKKKADPIKDGKEVELSHTGKVMTQQTMWKFL